MSPAISSFMDENAETKSAFRWFAESAKNGVLPQEFSVFARFETQLNRGLVAIKEVGCRSGFSMNTLNLPVAIFLSASRTSTKGRAFRAVVVMSCARTRSGKSSLVVLLTVF